jgi:hypothetical protein
MKIQLQRNAGRGVKDLGKRLREHVLEGLRCSLVGEDGGEESASVHVAVAHGNHVPGLQQSARGRRRPPGRRRG